MLTKCRTIIVLLVAFAVSDLPHTLAVKPATQDKRLEQIKLQLRTIVDSTQKTDKTQFGPNDNVAVQVLATNSGPTQAILVYLRTFIHFVPTLLKAGEVIPYSKAMEKRFADLEERERRLAEPGALSRDSASIAKLAPNQLSEAAVISLAYYYDKLSPGIYELKFTFRERTGFKIESDTIMFELTAEERKSPLSDILAAE